MDVWCIGDINYLVAVLNALAMLSNSGLFWQLIKIGSILGVLFMGIEVFMQHSSGGGGGMPWGRFILVFGAFYFLFGQTTTVHVADTYSLQSQDVDNVPYGVAVTGSIISKIAHEITLNLEQAFSLPTMSEYGFGGPLQTLIKGDNFFVGLDTLYKGKITKTLVEYADKCTAVGINKGQLDANAIGVNADPWAAMRWESDIYYAMTWLPSDPDQGTLRTCTDAWSQIDSYVRGQMWTDWNTFLSSQICTNGTGTCDPVATMQSALDWLGVASQDAQNYMLASVLVPVLEQGRINFSSFMGKPELGILIGQARQQRNLQWQAEGSLFMNIARPMMAFFEGFLYAITPFMALLIGIVPAGFQMIGKYILMFVWVQLWMPVLAILNQYVEIVAQHKLSFMTDGSIPFTSMQGHLMGVSGIQDWLGTAGVLVASTPAITLALLFGGAYTMVNLAGRLQHGEHITPQEFRPNLMQTAPLHAQESMMMGGPTHGDRATGAEGIVPRLEASQFASRDMQSSTSQLATAQQSWREGVSQMAAHGSMGGAQISQALQSSHGVDGRSGSSFGSVSAMAQMAGHDMGLSQTDTAKLAGNMAAGLNFAGSGANVTSGFDSAKGQQINQWMKSHLDLSGNKTLGTSIDEKMSSMTSTGELRNYGNTFKADDISNVDKSSQKLEQAQKQYSESVQLSTRAGMSQSVPLTAFGKLGADGRAGMTFAQFQGKNQSWLPPGLVEEAAVNNRAIYGISNPEQARWMGAAEVMTRMSKYAGTDHGEQTRAEMANKALLGTMDTMGFLAPATGDATQNRGMVDTAKVEAAGRHAAKAAAILPGPGDVQGHLQGIKAGIPGVEGPGDVRQWETAKETELRAKQNEQMEAGARNQYQRTMDTTSREWDQNKGTSQTFLEGSMGIIQGALGKTIPRVLSTPGSAEEASVNPQQTQEFETRANEARGEMLGMFAQKGKSLGLDEDLSRVYAHGAMGGFKIAANEKLGANLSPPEGYAEARAQAIQARTELHQQRGYSHDDAGRLAQQEVHLAEKSGQTGMDGWARRITQGDASFRQLREAQFDMGPGPGPERGPTGTPADFRAGVHGEDAKAPYITGTSLEGLNPQFMQKLRAMSGEYHQLTGKSVHITDGWRSYQAQVEVRRTKGNQGAIPGHSNHGLGKAVDMRKDTVQELTKLQKEGVDLLAKHGLTRPMMSHAPGHKYEPWHVELGSQKLM